MATSATAPSALTAALRRPCSPRRVPQPPREDACHAGVELDKARSSMGRQGPSRGRPGDWAGVRAQPQAEQVLGALRDEERGPWSPGQRKAWRCRAQVKGGLKCSVGLEGTGEG